MKIDDKVMCYFESSNTPVDKEGYLYKKGEIKTSYQKRWFVLKGNLLFYKERPVDRDLIGVIVLEGCTVQLCESDEQFAFSLVWNEPGLRTYKFAAEDQASQESWIKALLSANYCYLALLVTDMERKYREALGPFSSDTTDSFIMPNCTQANAGYPSASFRMYPSSQPSFSASVPGAGPGLGPSPRPMLQPSTAVSTKSASKRSPKMWPKKSTNAVPAHTPAVFFGDWAGVTSESQGDFIKMHEEFGKEVKELISHWAKRGQDGEENLIDLS